MQIIYYVPGKNNKFELTDTIFATKTGEFIGNVIKPQTYALIPAPILGSGTKSFYGGLRKLLEIINFGSQTVTSLAGVLVRPSKTAY